MIQLTLNRNLLDAFAGLTSARASALDPLCAVHLRHYDEFSLHIGAGNGELLCYGRLVTGGELLKEYYWDPEEDGVVSLKLNDASTAAFLAKAFKTVKLTIYQAHAMIEGMEEGMTSRIEVPRIRMDVRNLFVAMADVSRASLDDVSPRGQLFPPIASLHAFEKAGKLLGVMAPREIAVAQLGEVFSLTFGGGQADWWGLTKCRTTVTDGWAGMPPDWIAGEGQGFVDGALHVLDVILGPEQAELPLAPAPGDEDAPAEPWSLQWHQEWTEGQNQHGEDEDVKLWEACSCQCAEPGDFFHYRIKERGERYGLFSDPELLQDGDAEMLFTTLDDAKGFCEAREDEAIAASMGDDLAGTSEDGSLDAGEAHPEAVTA
ncbi:MAG: hypothetical protein ACYDCO_01885 [Armatimonadota bacterium]